MVKPTADSGLENPPFTNNISIKVAPYPRAPAKNFQQIFLEFLTSMLSFGRMAETLFCFVRNKAHGTSANDEVRKAQATINSVFSELKYCKKSAKISIDIKIDKTPDIQYVSRSRSNILNFFWLIAKKRTYIHHHFSGKRNCNIWCRPF